MLKRQAAKMLLAPTLRIDMHSAKTDPGIHPSPVDRNKSIIWARYLIDSTDWLMLAINVSRAEPSDLRNSVLSSSIRLLTLSVVTPGGKVLFETMLKPQQVIPNELISDHGIDQAVVFNALPFSEIVIHLNKLFEGRKVLAWDLNALQELLDEVSTVYAQPQLPLIGFSLRPEYARFVGQMDTQAHYSPQELKVEGKGATAQCRALLSTLYEMASSSQSSNNAVAGNQGWTGEFYRPKVSATEKIKDFLGL